MSYMHPTVVQPTFHSAVIDEGCADPSSFFIYALPVPGKAPDVVAYGRDKLTVYANPWNNPKFANKKAEWKPRVIGMLTQPTGMTHADITDNGSNDIIIGDLLGTSLNAINEQGGRISWFENPGKSNPSGSWIQREVGRNSGNFCIAAGHFSDPSRLQVASFPFSSKNTKIRPDLTFLPVSVVVFTCPDDSRNTQPWPSVTVNDTDFSGIKEVKVIHSTRPGGLDKLLVGDKDGISLMWYDEVKWMVDRLTPLLRPESESPEGILAFDYGKVGDDPVGYIIAAECPDFCLTVHVRDMKTPADGVITRNPWKKLVLDNFDRPHIGRQIGMFHNIICADFDGDGVDECIVSIGLGCDHEHEVGGVWYYKPLDLAQGRFAKWRIGDIMSGHGHCCVGDFTACNSLDIATNSVTTPGHQHMIELHVNGQKKVNHAVSGIVSHNEVVLRVPERSATGAFEEVALFGIGDTNVSLILLPAGHCLTCPPDRGIGVKVLDGKVEWTEKGGKKMSRGCLASPGGPISGLINPANGLVFSTGGAMILMFTPDEDEASGPYDDISQLTVRNKLPEYMPEDVQGLTLPFTRANKLDWAKEDARYRNAELYNSTGIHIRRNNVDAEPIVHIQLWAAGAGQSYPFRDRSDKAICEVRYCLFNSTGMGGIRPESKTAQLSSQASTASMDVDETGSTNITYLPEHWEHGALWEMNEDLTPKHLPDGRLSHPPHEWCTISLQDLKHVFPNQKQCYDVWMSFEFPAASIRKLVRN